MDKVVDHLFVFEGQGKIRDYPGNYTQYRDKLADETAHAAKQVNRAKSDSRQEKKQEEKIKLTYGERLEFEKLEKNIELLEDQKSQLAEKLSNSRDNAELMKISDEMDALVKTLDNQTERWMELAQWVE
jgi:ATP-binding cassette subfamily F protein uup